MSGHYLIYVRRSYKKVDDADTSDEAQLARCLALLPVGATHDVITDSGGHNSGRSEKRAGWQEILRRIAEEPIAGIVAYDVARLARNARLTLNLHHALEAKNISLTVAQMPGTNFSSAEGRFLLGQMALVAAFQADYDSKRMIDMMRATFEDGRHRGGDPFGYRTERDNEGKIVHPRSLAVVPDEAEIIRRVFRQLTTRPFAEIAASLNAEGVRHRQLRAWTNSAVKALWRRREVYRGNVVTRRGAEFRPGQHEPIITEEEFRDAVAGVEARKRQKGRKPPTSKRHYLLRGLVHCSCGARMRGDARLSRGQEWRYYACPVAEGRGGRLDHDGNLIACHAKRVRADAAERFVVEALSQFLLPAAEIAAAREELRDRLKAPKPGVADEQRARLRTRLEKLRDLYTWSELTEDDYRKQKAEAEAQLVALPDNNKLVVFDRHRALAASLPDAIAAATPNKVQELVALLVERVEAANQRVAPVTSVPAARPFFRDAGAEAEGGRCAVVAPPERLGGSGPHAGSTCLVCVLDAGDRPRSIVHIR